MKKQVKVLHVVGKRHQGGIGTFLHNMTKNIDNSKFSCDFLINASSEAGEFDKKMNLLGANVYILPELKYKNTLRYYKKLKAFYELNHNYDIIHIHSANITLFNYWATRKYKDMYIAVHSHSTKYSDKFLNSVRNFFLHIPVKRVADMYFACSKPAGEFMFGEKNMEAKEVHIVQNAIDTKLFSYNKSIRKYVREKLGIKDQLIIGHVGAFVPVKNHDFIINIFFEIKKLNNSAILILIGNGELEENIKKKVEELNLSNSVRFLGRRTDVYELMQAFDIFIMPSKFEGVPLVGVEAQASGLPCFFSDTITKDIKITELANFKSIKESPIEWADEILKIEDKLKRIDTCEQIAEAGYDIKSVVKKLEGYYLNLLKQLRNK